MKNRLDEALHLLATTQQSLAEIAFATGFRDQSAFTRHFRRLTGLPPGAFRAQAAGRDAWAGGDFGPRTVPGLTVELPQSAP